MSLVHERRTGASPIRTRFAAFALVALVALPACAPSTPPATAPAPTLDQRLSDQRVGLRAGLMNAGEATSNMRVVAKAVSPPGFLGITNSDLAFTGNYVIQGNYNGPVVWDISNPASPQLVVAFNCPASQNDVSVYRNLMFMSAEANNGRVDCAAGGVPEPSSANRMRGVRIFDISDIKNPRLVANVQTCRGSHTHTVLEDPKDKDNVYIYVSGSAGIRPQTELAECVRETPDKNPNSSLLRIEIIKVPLANPAAAAVVNRANIFAGLTAAPSHGQSEEDRKIAEAARARGAFTATIPGSGDEIILPPQFVRPQLDSIVKARGGTGAPTAADSAAFRAGIQPMINRMFGNAAAPGGPVNPGSQCHDITVYPARGLAGGACEGHGLLLDISDPVNPRRLDAVADSNFAYWHSATFNNDGTKLLFSDEWGGGGGPKCRALDRMEWGSNAIFTIENNTMKFQSYYKIPTVQTANENCVAHNGSLIPIPGRDVMVQAWYQGGISVFDWTDAARPKEIAFFDRGPVDSTRMEMGGSWSVYWYNGSIVSSEIARGLDVAELTPSEHLTQNEIDAAKTVRWNYLNAQGQPKIEWPASFSLAKAYLDQLERGRCLSASRVSAVRRELETAERASGAARGQALQKLSSELDGDRTNSCDKPKVDALKKAVNDLMSPVAM
jgi:LVIVD repeat